MEVIVRCAECSTDMEEHKVGLAFGSDALIEVTPCEVCLDNAYEQGRREAE